MRECAHTRMMKGYKYIDSKTEALTYQHVDDDTRTSEGDSTEDSVCFCESVRCRRARALTHERQSERKRQKMLLTDIISCLCVVNNIFFPLRLCFFIRCV